MTDTPTDPAEQALAAVAAAFPALRQAEPRVIGAALGDWRLGPDLKARFSWAGYDVHVSVGHEDYLNRDDSDDATLYREVRAHATLLATDVSRAPVRSHAEWQMTNPRPEIHFPAALTVAVADLTDPRFRSAVLATVALALDYALLATGQAATHAAEAAEEQQWERERPHDVTPAAWRRLKRQERQEQTAPAREG